MRFIHPKEAGWPDMELVPEPIIEDVRWYAATKYDDLPDGRYIKRSVLCLKHPVHGWMSLLIPREDVQRLAEILEHFKQQGNE